MQGDEINYRMIDSEGRSGGKSGGTNKKLVALSIVSLSVAAACVCLLVTQPKEYMHPYDSGVATSNLVESPEEIVFLPVGTVRGKQVQLGGEVRKNSGSIFKGIPYAKAKRFQAPVDPDPVAFIDATRFRPSCMRSDAPRDEVSEDCLFLNVYSPRTSAEYQKNLLSPVLVWFHGGSFTMGAGSDTTDESVQSLVASHRLVVVTINYRLGAFGFLGSDKLRGWDGSTGNAGILDQQHALKWVQKHIEYFGGDKNQVGIVGWSAGGASVSVHLAAPSSRPLFHIAMAMSGGFTDWSSTSLEQTDKEYMEFIKATGCDKYLSCSEPGRPCQCLEDVSVDDILTAQGESSALWAPTVDGVILTASPMDSLKSGNVHKAAKMIIGSAVEDALEDIGADATPEMFKDFIKTLVPEKHQTPENLEKCYNLYMNSETTSDLQALPGHASKSAAYWAGRRITADQGMTCIARRAARLWAEKAGPAYWYLWEEGSLPLRKKEAKTAGTAATEEALPTVLAAAVKPVWSPRKLEEAFPSGLKIGECWPCDGATHGSDLPFLFEEASTNVNVAMADLADTYHTFFANFLINEDPNKWNAFTLTKDSKLAWPEAASLQGISFRAEHVYSSADIRKEECDFWDSME